MMELCLNENERVERIRQEQEEAFWRKQADSSVLRGKRVANLQELIAELRVVFESDNINVEYINALMSAYKSNFDDWKQYAKFDRYKYTRNLVDTGNGKYNLMLLCWGEGHGSGIHDHANSHCFMKMLEGSLTEVRYAWPKEADQKMDVTTRTELLKDEVLYMHDDLGLHRVENSSCVERAVSLHLYCPPYDKCKVFNENTGHQLTSTVTFWSKYGKRNKETTEEDQPEDN